MKRAFILGSEWLYIKLYMGRLSADYFLSAQLMTEVKILKRSGLIDSWFFIRYEDPDFHLRIRFHIPSTFNIYSVISHLNKILVNLENQKIVSRIEYGTYTRELERYGAKIYQSTEQIFSVDSDAVLMLLNTLTLYENKDVLRWMAALVFVDDLITVFNLTLEQKATYLKKHGDSYKSEFGYTSIQSKRLLDKKYRISRELIIKAMTRQLPKEVLDITTTRYNSIQKILNSFKVGRNVDSYLSSLIHMSINRLFFSSNRFCEMVIYDFLERHYKSVIEQKKYHSV